MSRFFMCGLITLFSITMGFSQESQRVWTDLDDTILRSGAERAIVPQKYRTLQLNESSMKQKLASAPLKASTGASPLLIDLPMPDGEMAQFEIFEYKMMEDGLAAKFPEIKTYTGRGVTDPTATIKLDITPQGFHGVIHSTEGSTYIDPYYRVNQGQYISYHKKDYKSDKTFSCGVEGSYDHGTMNVSSMRNGPNPVGATLRSYRLAVAATGEYSTYHGGTVALVQAAIVTAVNRINSVYEREVAVTMILVANNDQVIYLDANTDPYVASGDGTNMNANQSVINGQIGTSNYDIGHVFHTIGGGLARLGSVCTGDKAKGFSALPNPIGDPFAVDYVCHEIGHQFAATHTFNTNDGGCNGNRTGNTAYEPGSGVTIMAYAGLCSPSNFSSSTIDRFHVASFDQIVVFTNNLAGNNCASASSTGNTPPTVDAGPSGMIIPISTPFELTGSATDLEGDPMTYAWEQYDKGPATALGDASGNSPLFRPFQPSTSPTRIFPKIQDILFGSANDAEILPTYARNMTFRLTVRDNNMNTGGVDWDNMNMTVTDLAGPFAVNSQPSLTTWVAGTWVKVEWEVANTDQAPINCADVDILLSNNGGMEFQSTIVGATANDGSEFILVPQSIGGGHRFKIKCSNNVFFNINGGSITIDEATTSDYDVLVDVDNREICAGTSTSYDLYISSLLNYSDPVNFTVAGAPAGTTASFSNSTVTPGGTTTLNISNTNGVATGSYPMTVTATSASGTKTYNLALQIYNGIPSASNLIAPANASMDQSTSPLFDWSANADASEFLFELATDALFSNIVHTQAGVPSDSYQLPVTLNELTTYHWRVRADNIPCGEGGYSSTFTFNTEAIECRSFASTDVPLNLPPNMGSYTTENVIGYNYEIRDVNVINLTGTHENLGEVTFTLESPSGTVVELVNRACDGTANYNVNFDGEGMANLPCPYNNGGTYQPSGSLGDFNGEMSGGTWTLTINDAVNFDFGNLLTWGLEFCFSAGSTNTEDQNTNISNIKLFPNPAEDLLFVEMTAEAQETTIIRMVNAAGQLLKELAPVQLTKGTQLFEINTSGLSNGVYFIHAIGEESGAIKTEKFTVLK